MKGLSLRAKITLWFSAAMILVVLFTYVSVLSVSERILQKTVRDNLIETVENNFHEIRYFPDLSSVDFGQEAGHFLAFESGYLEVEDDFLNEVNLVYTALYRSDAALLYGENPIPMATAGLKFADSRLQTVKADGMTYYVFDRKLTSKGLDGLWLRGVVSEEQGSVPMTAITRLSLILLPVIVLIACFGGYAIVKRMLRPIQKISETARQIGRDGDLKKRIALGPGNDELHRLADTFNETFEKLDAAFETERRFLSDASHELRTPMSVISAQCELSLEEEREPEEYREALGIIRRQSRRMSRMIGDMLEFTRLESGTERYPSEELDLSALVSSLSADMALIGEKGITLSCKVEEGLRFTGNRELLTRLLSNLIANAYRYGRPGGKILVILKKEGEHILLSVADDGIGIPQEEQEKIFGRFYQVSSSRSGEGAGLGLSMVSEIARFHGGTVSVSSEPGVGSTFTVTF